MDSGRIFFDPSACRGNMLFLGNGNPLFRGPRTLMTMEESSKKRPFFSSPDELFDDEYYDEQMPEKKRRLTPEQVHLLEKSFESENKLEPERKTQLAKKLGLQPRQVAVWFQNRRARWKTKQLERDYDILKASYDSLLSKYDSVLEENGKLKSEVVSLTDKLQVQPNEVIVTQPSGPRAPSVVVEAVDIPVKVEDRLSSGSTGSAVVDEHSPQLVDSGDSFFPTDDYASYEVPGTDGINSEDDDGSNNAQGCYLSDVLTAAEQEQHEGEALGWWVWS